MRLDLTDYLERRYKQNLARWRAKRTWHRWFAWHPVDVGVGDWRWLEYVERYWQPNQYGKDHWVYRPPSDFPLDAL